MGTKLQQILRSLCYNTEWKYAIFWKLKHRSRLMLTWEDGYYNNCDQQDTSESKCFSNTKKEKLQDGLYSHDPLGLAVAKMSYHVYSLGEGIVGQVAVTGKHQWIFADKHVARVSPSFEHSDGWQTQFSAGIRTIVVIPVVPHGVVQLGSLKNVHEDMKLVTHIRDVFMTLQDSSVGHIPLPLRSTMSSSLCLPEIPTINWASDTIPDCLHNLDQVLSKERTDVWLPNFPYLEKGNDSSYFQLPGNLLMEEVDALNKIGGLGLSTCGNDEASNSQSETRITRLDHKIMGMNELVNAKYKGETSSYKDNGAGSVNNANPFLDSMDEALCDVIFPTERAGVDYASPSSNLLDSSVCENIKFGNVDYHQNGLLHASEPSGVELQKDPENLEFRIESSHIDKCTSLEFPAGYELLEALGPAFLKKNNYFASKAENTKVISSEMSEQISCSQLTSDSCSEHLLEAVVANIHQCGTDNKSEKLSSRSVQSLLTTEKFPEPSSHTTLTTDSSNFSIDEPSLTGEGSRNCLSTSVAGIISPKSMSSACLSACSELDRSSGPTKNNKKRARPGESCRPRPRDRQLIQDRIKELRELIPNGAKCSIDSLLERTVKHMLFLQSITKHADKLNKSADLKSHHKERNMVGSTSYEQGSSWAVEVGGNLKVCSIIVENLNKNGQMVVEMMCEDCSHFLEIAESIRSLGLTILKGATEARGEKTWICFVVEPLQGENNRNVHRMDILLSLVQILQPKNATQQS